MQWHLNYLLCQFKETQEACETVWTEHISACRLSQLRVCSVSYTCKILLCLLCISLDSWGSSRAFAQSPALFFPRFTGIRIRDSFSLGHSFKENKRLIGLMMNYSVLFKTAICLYYSYTVSELSQRWALRVTLAFCGDDWTFSWTILLQVKDKHVCVVRIVAQDIKSFYITATRKQKKLVTCQKLLRHICVWDMQYLWE